MQAVGSQRFDNIPHGKMGGVGPEKIMLLFI
jgi:hypothetical protein